MPLDRYPECPRSARLRGVARTLKRAKSIALVWSEDDSTGGAHIVALADAVGDKAAVYYVPRTPNGRGVAAFYSGSLMPPEVHRAMERASEQFVEIVELQRAVGGRLAHFAGTEASHGG